MVLCYLCELLLTLGSNGKKTEIPLTSDLDKTKDILIRYEFRVIFLISIGI
jgi:hypothetical protein